MTNPLTNLTNPNAITTDGSTVDATAWTNDWSTVVNFINASLVASFNVFANQGDIMVYSGTTISALGVGTNGQFLQANSAAPLGVNWVTAATLATLTTKGDTLYYNSGNQRLAIGTTGQVLTVSAGGLPVWSSSEVPTGVIGMWANNIGSIPVGWSLCDGVANTNPGQSGANLQGLFVVGAGATSPAATGGMGLMNPGGPFGDNSAGAGLGPSHIHAVPLVPASGGGGLAAYTPTSSTTVTPKYYAVCFIEKI